MSFLTILSFLLFDIHAEIKSTKVPISMPIFLEQASISPLQFIHVFAGWYNNYS